MCGPKFCSMKVHTHLDDKANAPVTERAEAAVVAEALAYAKEHALPRTGSVAMPAPVGLGAKKIAAPPEGNFDAAGAGAAPAKGE
jgi:hypothetical protein